MQHSITKHHCLQQNCYGDRKVVLLDYRENSLYGHNIAWLAYISHRLQSVRNKDKVRGWGWSFHTLQKVATLSNETRYVLYLSL